MLEKDTEELLEECSDNSYDLRRLLMLGVFTTNNEEKRVEEART